MVAFRCRKLYTRELEAFSGRAAADGVSNVFKDLPCLGCRDVDHRLFSQGIVGILSSVQRKAGKPKRGKESERERVLSYLHQCRRCTRARVAGADAPCFEPPSSSLHLVMSFLTWLLTWDPRRLILVVRHLILDLSDIATTMDPSFSIKVMLAMASIPCCSSRNPGQGGEVHQKKRKVLPNVERKANGRLLVLHGQEVSNNCKYAGYRGYHGDDTRIIGGKKNKSDKHIMKMQKRRIQHKQQVRM